MLGLAARATTVVSALLRTSSFHCSFFLHLILDSVKKWPETTTKSKRTYWFILQVILFAPYTSFNWHRLPAVSVSPDSVAFVEHQTEAAMVASFSGQPNYP